MVESLTEKVMDYVRDGVAQGTMVPGQWYSVYKLASELDISRSPVRDGLLRLEEAGLISFTRNRGFQIVPTNPADVAELFALRLGIEPPAAYRAARQRTPAQLAEAHRLVEAMTQAAGRGDERTFFAHDRALHHQILVMGGARRGVAIVDRIRDNTVLLGHSTAGRSRSLADILAEHQPIIEAIERGDGLIAAAAMRSHLGSTGRLLLAQAAHTAGLDEQATATIWADYTAGLL